MIIDFHTHCFPEKIASRAMAMLAARAGCSPKHSGNETALSETVCQMGADLAVVLHIATNPAQQRSVNDYAISINGKNSLISFGSVHPESPDAFEELERLSRAGIKGIKLHPDYQGFFVEDEKLFPLYEKIGELGLITVFHSGVDIGLPDPIHCRPKSLVKVLPLFGGSPVVAAHFGGYMLWQEALEHLCTKNVYLDTAFSSGRIPTPWAKALIEKHGADKILLGSDMPWNGTDDDILLIKGLSLSNEDEAAVLGKNAQRLLNL